jgi:hypothetical protein
MGEEQQKKNQVEGDAAMVSDRSPGEDVFARVPEVAAQTDPVLKERDRLLEEDALSQGVRADPSRASSLLRTPIPTNCLSTSVMTTPLPDRPSKRSRTWERGMENAVASLMRAWMARWSSPR